MGVIGQQNNMGFYGKRQRSPAKNDQVVKPQEPTSLRQTDGHNSHGLFSVYTASLKLNTLNLHTRGNLHTRK